MFGLFKSKVDARDIGWSVAENSLNYTEPVVLGLKKLGKIESIFTEKQLQEFEFSLILNAGAVLVPLLMHYLRNISYDEDSFKDGARAYFDRYRDVSRENLRVNVEYQYDSCISAAEAELRINKNFHQTGVFYGGGHQDSVYANLIRFLAETTSPSVFSHITRNSRFNDVEWGYVLECIEGIDRSYRWLTQCIDYKRMKRS